MNSDTVSIIATLVSLRRVSSGRLIALADVALEVAGVEFTIQGVQVWATTDREGRPATKVELPKYRATDGRWCPAIDLPGELRDPMGRIVLEACVEVGICVRSAA